MKNQTKNTAYALRKIATGNDFRYQVIEKATGRTIAGRRSSRHYEAALFGIDPTGQVTIIMNGYGREDLVLKGIKKEYFAKGSAMAENHPLSLDLLLEGQSVELFHWKWERWGPEGKITITGEEASEGLIALAWLEESPAPTPEPEPEPESSEPSEDDQLEPQHSEARIEEDLLEADIQKTAHELRGAIDQIQEIPDQAGSWWNIIDATYPNLSYSSKREIMKEIAKLERERAEKPEAPAAAANIETWAQEWAEALEYPESSAQADREQLARALQTLERLEARIIEKDQRIAELEEERDRWEAALKEEAALWAKLEKENADLLSEKIRLSKELDQANALHADAIRQLAEAQARIEELGGDRWSKIGDPRLDQVEALEDQIRAKDQTIQYLRSELENIQRDLEAQLEEKPEDLDPEPEPEPSGPAPGGSDLSEGSPEPQLDQPAEISPDLGGKDLSEGDFSEEDQLDNLWSNYHATCKAAGQRDQMILSRSLFDSLLKSGKEITAIGKRWSLWPTISLKDIREEEIQPEPESPREIERPIAERESNKARRLQLLEDLELLMEIGLIEIRENDLRTPYIHINQPRPEDLEALAK